MAQQATVAASSSQAELQGVVTSELLALLPHLHCRYPFSCELLQRGHVGHSCGGARRHALRGRSFLPWSASPHRREEEGSGTSGCTAASSWCGPCCVTMLFHRWQHERGDRITPLFVGSGPSRQSMALCWHQRVQLHGHSRPPEML